jgi:hypothetical protein
MVHGVFSQNSNVELGSSSASRIITSHKGLWRREQSSRGFYRVNQFSWIKSVELILAFLLSINNLGHLSGWTLAYDGWDESEADQLSGRCFGGIYR